MAEKLISTLHCLPLPSVKDYPTAAVERGSLPPLRKGRSMDTNHTLAHTVHIYTQILIYSHMTIFSPIFKLNSTYYLTRGMTYLMIFPNTCL